MANRRAVMALFLDLEKAHDIVFRNDVPLKSIKLGINGPILYF